MKSVCPDTTMSAVLCDISKGGGGYPSLVLSMRGGRPFAGARAFPLSSGNDDVGDVLATGPDGLVVYNANSGLTRRLTDSLTTNGTDINNRGV